MTSLDVGQIAGKAVRGSGSGTLEAWRGSQSGHGLNARVWSIGGVEACQTGNLWRSTGVAHTAEGLCSTRTRVTNITSRNVARGDISHMNCELSKTHSQRCCERVASRPEPS
jgi:hypothetical protein